ncbi:desi1, partial [Symbiodinium microadriaticum]
MNVGALPPSAAQSNFGTSRLQACLGRREEKREAFRWGSWVDVDSVMQKALVQAADHGDPKVAFSNDNVPYIADLARMVLLNEKTGRKRILRFDPGDQANQAPKLPTLGQTGTTSWLSGSRCQVFVEGSGWKAMSIDNGATQTSLQGQRIFDVEAHGCRYRLNLEAFECTNLTLGRTSSMRPLQDAFTSPPAVQLSSYFSMLAGSEKAELLAEEAATSQWLAVALTTTTETEEGRDLILAGAGQLFSSLAVARPGLVTREEWMHFWLMRESAPSHYALAILQASSVCLKSSNGADGQCPVSRDFPGEDVSVLFEVQPEELLPQQQMLSPEWLRSAPKRPEAATLNYFEFVSELVGRQRHDVWLYQYSIPAGLAAEVEPAQAALLKSLGGFWHTSIVVFGREYWYGRQCFESKLQLSHFGEPTKRTYLGATQCSQAELWDKIDRELCREYTGDSYDVIQHSSCHFAQEVAWFLLNKHLPDEAWLQPPILASAITDIRPLLNQWFGRLSPEAGADEARGSDVAAAEGAWSQLAVGSLVSFARDGLPNVIAEVISKEAGACDLWWWEPRGSQNGRFVEAVGVSKMQVTNLGRHTGRWRGR